MRHLACLAVAVLLPAACLPRGVHAAQDVKNIDEPGRNPWQQTQMTQVNTGDCHKSLCVVLFRPVPKQKRLVVTYASALFDGSTALGVGGVDASVSDSVPGVPGAVVAEVPGLSGAGKAGHYQAGGALTLYVEQGQSPVMILDGASGTVRATIAGYLIDNP